MIIAIKHMVCPRCVTAVHAAAAAVGLNPTSVGLGEIALSDAPSEEQLTRFRDALRKDGFELVESEKARLVSKIKALIIERIHHESEAGPFKLSSFLSQKLNYDYSHLSKLFSSVEAKTIERFATQQRIERAKELLTYRELNIAEVAELLAYSSPAHLSAQFKQETGMTPTAFKKLKAPTRRTLDSI